MNTEEKNKTIYTTGAIASAIVICLTLLDIIAGSVSGGDLTTVPQLAVDKFTQLHENRLLGLYNLDLLNFIVSVIMIPTFTALFFALRPEDNANSLFSLIIFSIGTTVFIANNSALPLLELSQKFNSAPNEDQRALFAAAGEALIAKGAHGSPGVFPGFLLITLSELYISYIMLKTRIFSKATGYIGLAGTTLLLIYLVLITFVPSAKASAMIIVAPGGILSLIWMIMYTLKLFQLKR
jgi:hypothetical protein